MISDDKVGKAVVGDIDEGIPVPIGEGSGGVVSATWKELAPG